MCIETNGNKPYVRYDHAHDNVAFDKSNDVVSNNRVDDSNCQPVTRDQSETLNNDDDDKSDMTDNAKKTDEKPHNGTAVT